MRILDFQYRILYPFLADPRKFRSHTVQLYTYLYGRRGTSIHFSTNRLAAQQLRVRLWKVCAATRHNVSFVGSSGFYAIFQHTDGNRLHSMACGGQHSWEFTEPEMIAKIRRTWTNCDREVLMTLWPCLWPCGGAWWHAHRYHHDIRYARRRDVASSTSLFQKVVGQLCVCKIIGYF
jgi:hypothetical protein